MLRFQYRLAWQLGIADPDEWAKSFPEAKFRKWYAWWCVENEPPKDSSDD